MRSSNAVCWQGVRNVAALSLAINYPTAASAPHSIVNGFKKLLAVAVETDISFAEAEQVSGSAAISQLGFAIVDWTDCFPAVAFQQGSQGPYRCLQLTNWICQVRPYKSLFLHHGPYKSS